MTVAEPMTMTQRLQRWIELDDRRKSLEAEVKVVTSELEALREPLLDDWLEDGLTSVRVNGRTVWLQRQVYATVIDGDYARAARALKAAGLEDLLRPNTSTLSAFLREREAAGEPLPPSFDGAIGAFEKFAFRARKS